MKLKRILLATGISITIITGCIVLNEISIRKMLRSSVSAAVINTVPEHSFGPEEIKQSEMLTNIRNDILGLFGVQDCVMSIGFGVDSSNFGSYHEPKADIRLKLNDDGIFSYSLEQAVTEILKGYIPEIKDENIAITNITGKTDANTPVGNNSTVSGNAMEVQKKRGTVQ
jgi:hypothetical protein